MRRILMLMIVVLLAFPVVLTAQTPTFDELKEDAQLFADEVANTLPLNASVGLNWSDAYIGQFPHFGVGLTVGASTIPLEVASPILEAIGYDPATIANDPVLGPLSEYGMPLPAYAAEARLGGLIFPFDVGVKVGIMPPGYSLADLLPNVEAVQNLDLDYMNIGFDVRLPIVEERGLIPEVSVGGGYNRLNANIGFSGLIDNLEVGSFPNPVEGEPDFNVTLANPSVNYEWSANVIDLKAQVSKGLLIFRPYAGVGASLGFGRAGSGFEATLEGITPEQIDQANALAELLGSEEVIPDLTETSLYFSAPMTGGWSFRAYGGVALNILIVKLDINAMYDFLAGSYGATVGLRIQL